MIFSQDGRNGDVRRLQTICEFFGIDSQLTADLSDTASAAGCALIAPISAARSLTCQLRDHLHSCFFYADGGAVARSGLSHLTGEDADRCRAFVEAAVTAKVSTQWPELTGPMHGLTVTVEVRKGDSFANLGRADAVSPIVDTDSGPAFFRVAIGSLPVFVSCSAAIPDLDVPIVGKGYDVRKEFLSAVPLVMYLKWAFRDTCWKAREAGACWIVDDPPLKERYGFCDFRLLDSQMRQHAFTTNIAMIPWNWRRTSPSMASLVKESEGRLSVSVHGCDHTAREFGSESESELHARAHEASERMEKHRAVTGVWHDAVMVFPQGVFSRGSMRALQQHRYMAAISSEAIPAHCDDSCPTTADAWSTAIQRYSSYPLFTRRYPSDGVVNFAFDLLLGKPCLVVEHHSFYKRDHTDVVAFATALNSLNGGIDWRSLGEVIRRSYTWRRGTKGEIQVRMFANELLLENKTATSQTYRIQKSDVGSSGVTEVTADGDPVTWRKDGDVICFECSMPSGRRVLLQVQYAAPSTAPHAEMVRSATRRA